MSQPVIAFAGMTHLGINSAAASAAHGFTTIGFDLNRAAVDRLIRGDLPITEPQLPETIKEHKQRLSFTADPTALGTADVCYISADVPTDDEGRSELDGIRALIERVTASLSPDAILVILCQVPPGFTRSLTFSQQRLFYQVETLVFGRAVERAMHPERFIVGAAAPDVALPKAYSTFLSAFGCPTLTMRYESAELAKIAINFCLVASVSTANTLAELCERIGADWREIVPALKLDRRIGAHAYLDAGLGISGGNLERDLATVLRIADTQGTDVGIVKAWLANSRHRKDWPWRCLRTLGLADNPDIRIAVLGLAYKENTHSTKNSPALVLLEHLRGRKVRVHDPVVPASVVPWAEHAADPLAAAEAADVLVIATPWPEYRHLDPAAVAAKMTGRVLVDPYRMLDGRLCTQAGFAYHALGAPPLLPKA
jgi:UDPglucose 6-dehydrogenase